MIKNFRTKRGTFAKLDSKKQSNILSIVKTNRFVTITQLSNHLRISRATLKKYLLELNSRGLLSDKNYFLQRTVNPKLKRTRPVLTRKLVERRKRMVVFINEMRLKKKPLSVNLLQKEFGGEKSFVKSVLDAEEKKWCNSSIPIIRRTKSDQPKRSKI